jgi:hypothetical protein
MKFDFVNDEPSQLFCDDIIRYLIAKYLMTYLEAHDYVALQWAGQPFEGIDDSRYHWLTEEWADHIFEHHDYLFGSKGKADLNTEGVL